MTDVAEDERIEMAGRYLFERVKSVAHAANVRGIGLTDAAVYRIKDVIAEHRKEMKLRGIRFPKVVAIVMAKYGAIEIVRRDLDRDALQTIILNITVKYPGVTPEDIANGIHHAFPNLRSVSLDMRPEGFTKKHEQINGHAVN